MLRELSIATLGVIDSATIEFSSGLTALTGETGAGKTMVTTGIGLLLGDRAEAGTVRTGASQARVEGRFQAGDHLGAALDDLGAELDQGELLVARQVSEAGRSRAWVGGAQTTAGALAAITGELVTIHGQSEQLRLSHPDRQREVLDRSCGTEHLAAVAAYRDQFTRRRDLAAALDQVRSSSQERARQADLLRFGCDEIGQLAPQPGEDQLLHDEARRLQSMADLREHAEGLSLALSGDSDGDTSGAVGLVGMARKQAEQLSRLDDSAAELAERLTEVALAINDLAAEAARYQADLDVDPGRLEANMARQADLARLTRKYGHTIDEVISWEASAQAQLVEIESDDDRIEAWQAELDQLDRDLVERAAVITSGRRQAASAFAEQVRTELVALALPHARIEFRLEPTEQLGTHGAEQVSLLFTANPGSKPGPLGRVASGGELSRVRLAIEVTLASADADHTFIFDEVDAGIGGATALEVGRRLAQLARQSQVIVVTHLAQVAAFADRHVVVAKASDGQLTTSGLRVVDGAEREQELARMMAGLDAADAALAHARELLAVAQPGTAGRPRRQPSTSSKS